MLQNVDLRTIWLHESTRLLTGDQHTAGFIASVSFPSYPEGVITLAVYRERAHDASGSVLFLTQSWCSCASQEDRIRYQGIRPKPNETRQSETKQYKVKQNTLILDFICILNASAFIFTLFTSDCSPFRTDFHLSVYTRTNETNEFIRRATRLNRAS